MYGSEGMDHKKLDTGMVRVVFGRGSYDNEEKEIIFVGILGSGMGKLRDLSKRSEPN